MPTGSARGRNLTEGATFGFQEAHLAGTTLKPDVDAGRIPGVGMLENIEIAVAIEVGNFAVVPSLAPGEQGSAKGAFAVTVKDPGGCVRIVERVSFARPFALLGGEDVEVAVTVDIGDFESMAVSHVAVEQASSLPVLRILRVAGAFVDHERAGTVSWRDYNLRVFAGLEATGFDAASDNAYLDGLERVPTLVFEPVIAGEEVGAAVAINVKGIHPFGIDGGPVGAFACRTHEDRGIRPGFRVTRIFRDVREEYGLRLLIPEGELRLACSLEVGKDLIVVLVGAPILDQMTLPGHGGIEVRIGIFPPP
jgi:hypothetical protein